MNVQLNHPMPLLELDVLRTFVAIVETGSFAAAATAVFRTPSAVSMQIKKLEELLGRPMLKRDARTVSLTPEGEVLLGYARRMLALNREAAAKFICPEVNGVVRLGAPDDVGERILPEVMKRFARSHPGIMVDVIIDQSSNLLSRLDAGTLDLTLMTCQPDTLPVRAEILLVEPLIWAGAKGGHAWQRKPLPVSVWEEGCAWRQGALEGLEAAQIEYRIAYMSAHTSGQRSAILSDLAIAPLPKSFVGDDMVTLGADDGMPEIGEYTLAMVTRADSGTPVEACADHMRATFEGLGK